MARTMESWPAEIKKAPTLVGRQIQINAVVDENGRPIVAYIELSRAGWFLRAFARCFATAVSRELVRAEDGLAGLDQPSISEDDLEDESDD